MHASDATLPMKPVALLARAGGARDALHDALLAAGARIVLEEDPNALDPQALEQAAPDAILVALEPAIEDALERLAPALEASGVNLIFDDADVAASRSGWDAQRRARHLAAKLHGHGNVLPPGHDRDDELQLRPGLPETPQQRHSGAPFAPYVDEAGLLAEGLPRDRLHAAVEPVADEPLPWEVDSRSLPPVPESMLEPAAEPETGLAAAPEPAFVPPPSSWELVDEPVPPPVAPPALEAPVFTASDLSLVELEAETPLAPFVEAVDGAVLVLAGIGGPDAVRKLLAALPADFPRPVLVQLRLDGGRYDNLVKQMARVSTLPVALAEAGKPLAPTTVYVLPDDLGVEARDGTLFFATGTGSDLIAALPPAGSAVLMLSGSDPQRVEQAMALAVGGGLVTGQAAEGCYDPAASKLLAERGKTLGTPAELAQRLAERWS